MHHLTSLDEEVDGSVPVITSNLQRRVPLHFDTGDGVESLVRICTQHPLDSLCAPSTANMQRRSPSTFDVHSFVVAYNLLPGKKFIGW